MSREDLLKKVREKRKELEKSKEVFYFNNTKPKRKSRTKHEKKFRCDYKVDLTEDVTYIQLKKISKTADALEIIENILCNVAINLTESGKMFNKISLQFDASPFINSNGKYSDYVLIEDFQILMYDETINNWDYMYLYIVNYKELVKKIKELGYEISVEKPEEMRNDTIPTSAKVICDFTDINEETKEEKKEKTKTLTYNSDAMTQYFN